MPNTASRHDALLFRRAYPRTAEELQRSEVALRKLRMPDQLLDPEISGIAGTSVDLVFSYDMARWLSSRFPRQIAIDWDDPPDPDRLGAVLTTAIPFLQEGVVDANVSYMEIAKEKGLAWLLDNLAPLDYESLGLWIRWHLGSSRVTRTLMRRAAREIFYQRTPLRRRSDVSIPRELGGQPLPVSTLSRREGEEVLDMVRAALAVRYREVYCFTFGDPSTIISADCGRGLEILVIGILPERRLPLRAGFGTFFLHNGVPIGYADAFGLCEHLDVSFNIFYAFRSGESAFCFARLLKLYHQLFGSTVFSIDAYQLGQGNQEAIEAGAFWFYRKLGFRPTDPRIENIARREENRMAKERHHCTSASTLKKLARGAMIYEMHPTGEWDHFRMHNLMLHHEKLAIPAAIRRAKAGRSEIDYLRLMQGDRRLRRALLRLGST